MIKWDTVAIVGVGLIGGSIGLALKERALARRVVGIGRSASRLARAKRLAAIDLATTSFAKGVAEADLVVICTPVPQIAPYVLAAAEHCRPDAILTDAGSTKGRIVADVQHGLAGGAVFIGSHPLAGSDKQGVEHAKADLFDGAVCVLTPLRDSPRDALSRLRRFWESLGCRIVMMRPQMHDHALAQTSHLPHLLAAAVAGVLPDRLRELTATGFRDATRIAAGDPELWIGIFDQNREATLESLTRLEAELARYRKALQKQDNNALRKLLAHAKHNRDALGS